MKAIKRIIILIVVLVLITFAGVDYLKYRSVKETKSRNDDSIATTNINTDTYVDSYQNTTELYNQNGYRADGTSIDYYSASSYDNPYDSNEQQGSTTSNDSGKYILSEGKYYVGYGGGRILPGTYGVRVEGDMSEYFAHLKVQHLHDVGDWYTLGEGDGGCDLMFNKGLLDFYVNEGDYIEYTISIGEPKVTIYLK